MFHTRLPDSGSSKPASRCGVLLMFALSALAASACSAQVLGTQSGPLISVSGMGEVSAEADRATINLNVRTQAADSASAKKEVDLRVNAFFDEMATLGISDEEISAGSMSLSPQYDYQNRTQKFIGFQASRSISIELSDLEKLHPVLDAAVTMRIDEIRGINYSSSKEDEMRQQARLAAIEDSKQKARQLAEAYDAKLGPVYSINYYSGVIQQSYAAQPEMARMALSSVSDAGGGRFIPSEITVTDSISVVFDLITN